jgi:predicted  nucleic acid-binding Zn-ribbon protein
MRKTMVRVLVIAGIALVAGLAGSAAARGQAPPSPDVLSALLVEVRGLRAAMEQMASAGPRIELALGRLQLQEQRVNTLLRRHTEVRERVADAERGIELVAREIEAGQAQLGGDSLDDNERKAVQLALGETKARHAQLNIDVQRLRAEEADVAQLLAVEQGRWTEINQRLEELEMALTRR